MKNTLLKTAIFAISFSTLVIAQEPVSIRSLSLGGVIQDDWDLIYDPIELGFVNGTYIFTNLADLRAEDGNNFDENSIFNEFPIGISFNNPFMNSLNHALLLRLQNEKESEYISNGKYGMYEFESGSFSDSNNDGLYDYQTTSTGTYLNHDISRRTAFVFNNTYSLNDDSQMGLSIAYDNTFSEEDEAQTDMGLSNFGGFLDGVDGVGFDPWYGEYGSGDFGFNTSTENYNMSDEYIENSYSENGSFSTILSDHFLHFNLAYMLKLNFEYRIDLLLQNKINGKVETDDSYSGDYINYDDSSTENYEIGNISEIYKQNVEDNWKSIKIGGSIKNVFMQADHRKNDGYWKIGTILGINYGKYENSVNNDFYSNVQNVYTNSLDNDTFTESDYLTTNDIGNISGYNMEISSHFHYPVADIINFGLGFYWNFNKLERETDYTYQSQNISESVYNNSFDDYLDQIETTTMKSYSERTYIDYHYQYRIPVGIEIRMPDADLTDNDSFILRKFSFRIGTTYYSNRTVIFDKHEVQDDNPTTIIIVDGTGDVSVETEDNQFMSTSTRTEDIYGAKRFSVGLGYRHSENLSINLGGYAGSGRSDDPHPQIYYGSSGSRRYNDDEDGAFIGLSFTFKL